MVDMALRFEEAGDLAPVIDILAAHAADADHSGDFPHAGIAAVHKAGLLEQTVAQADGGAGISDLELTRLLALLGRGDPSVALISSMTLLIHRQQRLGGLWPIETYRSVLKEAAHSPILLNSARGEPELGSPARGGLPATVARRTAGGWSISGTKRFVTGADGLRYFLVWARTDEHPARVGTFIVRNDRQGITITRNWKNLGMRATGSHDVTFHEVEVPLDDVIGLTDPSVAQQDNRAGALTNLMVSAIYLGVAEAARDAFLQFAFERIPTNLGKPLASTERFVTLAGEIDLLVGSARQLIMQAVEHAADRPESLLRARIAAARYNQQAVTLAVRSLGNPGLSGDLTLERHFRNIQSATVHAPQEDTVLSILGRASFAAFQAAQDNKRRPLNDPATAVVG